MISARPGTIVTVERVINKASHATVGRDRGSSHRRVEARDMKLFTTIDHSADARTTGLELPLKVLVRADPGRTCVSYNTPAELAARYQLSDELAAGLAGIEALTARPSFGKPDAASQSNPGSQSGQA